MSVYTWKYLETLCSIPTLHIDDKFHIHIEYAMLLFYSTARLYEYAFTYMHKYLRSPHA